MRKFAHLNARSIEEAVSMLRRYGDLASIIAGGTDLLGKMKDDILPKYPEALINIKTIPGLNEIKEKGDKLHIGALCRLEDIAGSSVICENYVALAQAAQKTASPHIREMGTIGGNICQDIRCWYYRNPKNRFPCLRKGGGRCYAIEGDNRYHSIFGGSVEQGCYAVHPSDIAPALIALDAKVRTSKRTIEVEDLFEVGVGKTTVLDSDEIVIEIAIPHPSPDTKSAFIKFAIREAIDFPMVNCAAMIINQAGKATRVRICLNAVYVKPYRAKKAEQVLLGKPINESSAEEALTSLMSETKPLKQNAYLAHIAKTLVKRTILECG